MKKTASTIDNDDPSVVMAVVSVVCCSVVCCATQKDKKERLKDVKRDPSRGKSLRRRQESCGG